jgi:hypothetical protein
VSRLLHKTGLLRILPPWLRRTWGAKLVESLGEQIDELVQRTADGVSHRFPAVVSPVDEDALALTGRERRILRGPLESAANYGARLRTWWDAHRTRGGAYALLEQIRAYFVGFGAMRVDVVAQSGLRRWMDTAGVITRDAITWQGDASGKWARIWVFFYVTSLPRTLVTHTGARLVTHTGDVLIADSLVSGTISDQDAAMFTAIPREWSAAHIDKTTVVLLSGDACLVGYPPRLVGDNPPNTVTPTTPATILEIVH